MIPVAKSRRIGRAAGVAILVIATLAAVLGGLSRLSLDTGLSAFLPANDPSVVGLQRTANDYGGDPIVALLETATPQALFTDSNQMLALLKLEGALSKLQNVAAVYGPATVLNQTAGAAQDMLAELSGRRDGYQQLAIAQAKKQGLSAAAAQAAGDQALAAFDRRYAPLLVEAMPAGLPTLSNPKFVNSVLFDTNGNPRPLWRYVVPNANDVAILVRPRADLDQSAAGTLTSQVRSLVSSSGLKLSRSTITGVPAVGAALTDRVRREAPILGGIAIVVVGLVFFASGWTRRRRSRLRPVLAALTGSAVTAAAFGWVGHPISLGVVAFLPILLGIGSDFPLYLTLGGRDRRVIGAACAAIVGFLSLAISPLPFVKELGLALAFGLAVTLATSWLMRRMWGPAPSAAIVAKSSRTRIAVGRRTWAGIGAIGMAVAVAGWVLLPSLKVEADPQKLASGLPELAAANYAGQTLRSDGEITVELTGANVATPAMLAWQTNVESQIVRQMGDSVHPIVSVADLFAFLGANPTQSEFDAAAQLMPSYLTSAVLRSDGKSAVAEYGVQFTDVRDLGPVIAAIQTIVANPPAGMSASVVGIPIAAHRGLDLVSHGRLWMNILGIVGAGLALAVCMRRKRVALLSVATVSLATGWVTVLAYLVTGELNPLTVAVGSLITATGCEFTVMLERGGSIRPVLTAALAGTLGYAIIAFSELSMLREFGLLLAAGVASSLAAAILVTRIWPQGAETPGLAAPASMPREEVLV